MPHAQVHKGCVIHAMTTVSKLRLAIGCSPLQEVPMSDGLYPEIEPYQTAFLERDGHRLYYELSGNPTGPTALFLHGGPGGGTSPRSRRC